MRHQCICPRYFAHVDGTFIGRGGCKNANTRKNELAKTGEKKHAIDGTMLLFLLPFLSLSLSLSAQKDSANVILLLLSTVTGVSCFLALAHAASM